MERDPDSLRDFVRLVLEGRGSGFVRISSGEDVPFGSSAHVNDLEGRILSLTVWRDASSRGSEKRANYARLIGQLRNELRAARRYAVRNGAPALSTSQLP